MARRWSFASILSTCFTAAVALLSGAAGPAAIAARADCIGGIGGIGGTTSGAYSLWAQCGGKSNCPVPLPSGATCGDAAWGPCASGSTCTRQNEWYYQCLPAPSSSPASPPSSSSPSPSSSRRPSPRPRPPRPPRPPTPPKPPSPPRKPPAPRPPGRSPMPPMPSPPDMEDDLSPLPGGASGTARTTRYFDCCRPSCSWPYKAAVTQPVRSCTAAGGPLTDPWAQSGCTGGSAFTCSDQTPFVVNSTLAYGFAAVAIKGEGEADWCCACYLLTFTSGPVAGKKMVVMATNTGGDLDTNGHFDLAVPGAGQGDFSGCSAQYPGYPRSVFGAQYGGVSSEAACDALPPPMREGCRWRWTWMNGADNPDVSFQRVKCPAALLQRTGCKRLDE